MPKVSIIVPVYNVQSYIEKCLISLVNQTLQDIEIIIVNDGSTDDSEKIILNYKQQYEGKIIYLTKENGGLSDARNFGIPYATGEYIAFLDSDDYVENNIYELMYNKAKEQDSDMVECDFYWAYPNRNKKDTGNIYKGKKPMIVESRVVAWNKLIKSEVLKKSQVKFPKGLHYEDVEFFYKLIPHLNNVSFVKQPLIYYVQRNNSISNTQTAKTKDIFIVLQNVIEYYKQNNIYEEYKVELEYIYARYLLCSSLKRITKIKNKSIRHQALEETWTNLNSKFPNWKNNKILNCRKSVKNFYMKTVNKFTFKIYTQFLEII